MFEFSTVKPVYHQIADWLENEILKGAFKEGERIPSQAAIAQQLHVNPLPAAKKRIYEYRKNESLNALLDELLTEADTLGIDLDELCRAIEERAETRKSSPAESEQ